MTERELYEKVLEFERVNDVNKILFEDVEVWPLCRVFLKQRNLQKISAAGKNKRRSFLPSVFWNFLQTYRLRLSVRPSDILILTGLQYYTDEVEGLRYDRHADSFYEFVKGASDFSALKFIDCSKRYANLVYKIPGKTLDLRALMNIRQYMVLKNRIAKSPLLNEFFDRIHGEFEMDIRKSVSNSLAVILSSQKAISAILQKVEPSLIVAVCYYTDLNFAFKLASRRKGISFADLQHGKQGVNHILYSGWTAIPENGYTLLPDYFWLWGQKSRENILRSMNSFTPETKIIGNLWMLKWRSTNHTSKSVLSNRLTKYQRVVVFSLQQALEKAIPDFVLEEIKNTEENTIWLFRLHPGQSGNERVLVTLNELGVKNWEIEESSKLPLYEVLSQADIHLTCWSSFCIEALEFGLKTTLVHPFAKDEYANEISNALFYYADDIVSLKEALARSHSLDTQSLQNDYFMFDPSKSLDVVRESMNSTKAH